MNLNARQVFYMLVHACGINFPHCCCKVMLFEPLWISRAEVARSGGVFSKDPLCQLF